jgi:transposase
MAKYDEQFKLTVVREAAQGIVGRESLARRYGLDHSMVRRWVASYARHGAAGLAKKYTRYDVAFKQQVLERIRVQGLSLRQATALFDIRQAGLIGQWQRQYALGGLGALAPASERRPRMRKKPMVPKPDDQLTREELLEEVAYLRAETAYLKKLDALILHEQTATRDTKRKPSKD